MSADLLFVLLRGLVAASKAVVDAIRDKDVDTVASLASVDRELAEVEDLADTIADLERELRGVN